MVTTALMTAEELAQLPDDGYQYELVRGELRRMPPPKPEHGELLIQLGSYLWLHVRPRGLGKVYGGDSGYVFERDPDTVLGPDISFVRADRLSDWAGTYPEMAPDLAVEIMSPSDRPGAVQAKVRRYHGFGVPLVWILVPKRQQVQVHPLQGEPQTLGIDDELDGGDVLPDFRLPLRKLFEGV